MKQLSQTGIRPSYRSKGTILVSGSSVLPENMASQSECTHITVVLEVDPVTETILNADITTITELDREFLRDIIIGYQLSHGIAALLQEVRNRIWMPSGRSTAKAIENGYRRYCDIKLELSRNAPSSAEWV